MSDSAIDKKWKDTFAGKPYLPSSGSEGEAFMSHYCWNCRRDNFNDNTGEGGCPILAQSFSSQPAEWKYDDEGDPVCTAFRDKRIPPKKRKPKPRPAPLFESSGEAPQKEALNG